MNMRKVSLLMLLTIAAPAFATDASISQNAKVWISEAPDGFNRDLEAALVKKHVPLQIVSTKADAQYEIRSTSESHKAGAAKILITGNFHSAEQASVQIIDLKTDSVVYAYSVNKPASVHGRQSTAEACAKHIKEHVH